MVGHPPPGTPFRHPRGTQPPQGMQAKGTVLGPPHPHTRAHSTWVADPNSPPLWAGSRGRDSAWPHTPPTMVEGTPPGDAPPPPPQRATPARKGARCGTGAGSPRPHRPHPGHTGRGTLAARSRGRAAGGGPAPDSRRPSQRWQATPPRDGPQGHPRGTQLLQGMQAKGTVLGPHIHTPAPAARGWRTPTARLYGRAVGGGTARGLRRPSQWWKAPLPGTPFRHPHSQQHRPARAHAVGPVLGPHARTDRDTQVAQPWPPAPEDGRPGEGQRLTPGAPHNSGRPAPPGTPFRQPRGTQPPQSMQAKGTVLGPPHPHGRAHSTWVADPNSPPLWAGSRGRDSAWPQMPLTMVEGIPPGDALPPPAQRATPAWLGWCWVPTPAPTAPGTHGSRNPGRPLQRTGGRGRDSA